MLPGFVTESPGVLELSFLISLGGPVQIHVFNNDPNTGGTYTLRVITQ